jgi:gas vesicle protein
MDNVTHYSRDSFFIGLAMGASLGAGLAIWLAPRLRAELRQRLNDSAAALNTSASGRYQEVRVRVEDAVDDLTKQGVGIRNDIAEAIARGAQGVERIANAAKIKG